MKAKTFCISGLAALAIGLLATAGTATAQGTSDPKTGAYGGVSYGGVVVAPPVAPPVAAPVAEPVAQVAEPAPAAPAAPQVIAAREPSIYERWGLAVMAGGGPEGFESPNKTGAHTGGGWFVRATFGTKSLLGFEASYLGSAQPIDALGLSNNAILLGNGLQGALRLNLTRHYDVGVYLFGGAAWRHYGLANTNTTTADVNSSDDVLELPFGIGAGYVYRGLLFDLRADYRLTEYGNMMVTASNNDMNRWGIHGGIGYQF